MCRGSKRKCLHCKTRFRPDHRNRNRQQYCSSSECRKASKKASQKRWLTKSENRDYFKHETHVRRVQEWRKAHPNYWRNKDALQDSCNLEPIVNKTETLNKNAQETPGSLPLQDSLIMQHPLIIGLLSNLTGHTLQDDIARSAACFIQSGLDILSEKHNSHGGQQYDHQTDHPP